MCAARTRRDRKRTGKRDRLPRSHSDRHRLVDEVFPVDLETVEAAKTVLGEAPGVSARDALHLAVMRREGVHAILTFDRGFDAVPQLDRLS